MSEMVDGKMPLDAVHCVGKRASEHGRVQYQNVEWKMTLLECFGKVVYAVK